MLKLQEEGIVVQWRHNLKKRVSECVVKRIADDEILGAGRAKAVKSDPFNRKVGGKLSLTRALANAKEAVGKPARTKVWELFNNLSPKGPKWAAKKQ